MDEERMDQENFSALLEESLKGNDGFSVGDEINGRVVYITADSVFIDMAGKSEAVIDIKEFQDDKGFPDISVGDTVRAYVVSVRRGEILLTTRIGKGAVSSEVIETAHRNGIPVEGTVVSTTNGGYRVSLSGIECFCPFSQMDLKSPSNPEDLVGKSFAFKVSRVTEKGRNIVLSRRALLEETRRRRENELRESLKVGDVVTGRVSSRQKFGLFVDLDGVEALVPRAEVSWSRSEGMDSYSIGDEIRALVLSVDWENRRHSLSIRQAQPHPWENIGRYAADMEIQGIVTNIIKSGAFVEIEAGIEGFLPVSRMSYTRRVNRPEEAVRIGASVNVKIVEIDTEERKISLELLTGEADPWQADTSHLLDSIFSATVESVRSNGVTARLSNGMLGFIPREECAQPRGADLQSAYPAGKEVKAIIKSLDRSNKRLTLSETGAVRKEERQEYEKFMKSAASPEEGSVFGRLFKQKYEEIQKKG
ncbi:MAG TPA: S1 RNA-binding domain-containing protein [Spirochaetota bacterium]|nr:S1 RNA-binding domain-containing protein [Spirochaetota bacterium]HPV96321.1 S1 RNA-binding domain-containing protein [Spirochaetota bacterium]